MCRYVPDDKKDKGDVGMKTAVNNLDYALAELIRKNKEKIKSITPVNPAIDKDDEWRDENEWDELYKELKDK